MKPIYGLLASLLLVAAGVTWLFIAPEPEHAAGVAHPDVPGMRAGGRWAWSNGVILPAHMLQIGTLAAMSFLMFMAVPKARRNGSTATMFASAGLLSAIVWINITAFFAPPATAGQQLYVLGFPLASTIAVYGVWLAGLLFSGFYVFGFKQWVFSDEDQQKFDTLVAKYKPQDMDGEQS